MSSVVFSPFMTFVFMNKIVSISVTCYIKMILYSVYSNYYVI